jgi:hypothetical protein
MMIEDRTQRTADEPKRRWFRPSWRSVIVLAFAVAFAVALLAAGIDYARQVHCESLCREHLLKIHSGLMYYAGDTRRFPPIYSTDRNGRPVQSWRAYAIPCIWAGTLDLHLFRQWNVKAPWDTPNNAKFWERYGSYYCPGYAEPSSITSYMGVVGGRLWSKEGGVLPTAGKSLLIVELMESDTPWAKPEDIALAELVSLLQEDPTGGRFCHRVRHVLAADPAGAPYILDPRRDLDEVKAIVAAEAQAAKERER